MSLLKDVFKFNNIVTGLKALAVSVTFAVFWFLATWLVEVVATEAEFFAMLIYLVFAVTSLFIWGYVANRFWGWK